MARKISDPEEFERIIFDEISNNILMKEWLNFGKTLGLSDYALLETEGEAIIRNYELPVMINGMLKRWKESNKPEPHRMVPLLKPVLKAIGRKDLYKSILQIHKTEINKTKNLRKAAKAALHSQTESAKVTSDSQTEAAKATSDSLTEPEKVTLDSQKEPAKEASDSQTETVKEA